MGEQAARMTTAREPNEDRLDRAERILAEAAAAHEKEMAEIREMVQANTMAIAAIGARVDQLSERQRRTNQDMSVIKDWQTELAVERTAFDVFHRRSRFGALMRIFPKDELIHYTGNGVRRKFITEAEANQAAAVDFVMEGVDGSGAPVTFVVEASYAAGLEAIKRAVARAPLIAKILGREVVIPTVVTEVISQAFEDDARAYKIRWTYVANGNRITL